MISSSGDALPLRPIAFARFDGRQTGARRQDYPGGETCMGKPVMMKRAAPAMPFLIQPTIETMEEDHALQRLLCSDLETVADRLPVLPSLPSLRRISVRILCVTDTHLPRAEQILRRLPEHQRPTRDALDALHRMHALDQLHAQDLVATLWREVAASAEPETGQLAYMLRCFFDGCRRAIVLKESFLTYARRAAIMQD
jgi:hypothetical protein